MKYFFLTPIFLLIGCSHIGYNPNAPIARTYVSDIWTRYAATPTNISYIKTTYNAGDTVKSEDANKIGCEVNALNRFMRTGDGSPTAVSNLIYAILGNPTSLTTHSITNVFDADRWTNITCYLGPYVTNSYIIP